MSRNKFSEDDDLKMIHFYLSTELKFRNEPFGLRLWRIFSDLHPGHTDHSLATRFRKRIVPNIDRYFAFLNEEHLRKLYIDLNSKMTEEIKRRLKKYIIRVEVRKSSSSVKIIDSVQKKSSVTSGSIAIIPPQAACPPNIVAEDTKSDNSRFRMTTNERNPAANKASNNSCISERNRSFSSQSTLPMEDEIHQLEWNRDHFTNWKRDVNGMVKDWAEQIFEKIFEAKKMAQSKSYIESAVEPLIDMIFIENENQEKEAITMVKFDEESEFHAVRVEYYYEKLEKTVNDFPTSMHTRNSAIKFFRFLEAELAQNVVQKSIGLADYERIVDILMSRCRTISRS